LPNKFLGIEGKGSQALKSLGDKYSSEYLKKVQENGNLVSTKINSLLVQVDNLLSSNDFYNLVLVYEDLIKAYRLFPREVLLEKIKISNQVRKREVLINEKVESYKENKLKLIKERLSKVPSDMKKMLNPGYGKEIEEGINKLDYLLNSIPKLFMSDLTQERIALSKMLIIAEEYLQTEYLREYEEKVKVLNDLFENFHQHYLKGNLDGVLMVYDEILYQFEEVPEVFLDKKVAIYKKINSLYASINKLMIKSNVARFLETYNYSRSIEEVRDYLLHIKSIGKVNAKTLSILREKLKLIPDKYHEEKADIEKEIVYLVGAYNERKDYIDKQLVEK
jgi:hypothetical protein